MKKINSLGMLVVVVVFVSFYGCGSSSSGSGGAGQTALETPVSNISGTWKITETMGSNNCDEAVGSRELYDLKVVQNGNSLTVTDPNRNVFKGTISGSTIAWTGSFPDNGGTTTITEMDMKVTGGNVLSGTTNWTWTDGSFGCQGSSSISGRKI